ncbi:MAG TPA: sulfatase-like hydrolase/transferase, partial [Candidatus Sulfotelmatobacter sp.]|nr:sulfatase-like hydrolase/transferase [Candidatus Sulfotelmatobacter sp.]
MRNFRLPFLLVLLLFHVVGLPSSQAVATPLPDILLIMPDQMRGDCLSLLNHPVVRTPHLDQLARQGALFRRAYSTCPSCIPARHALLTGLFPATSGVVGYAARPIEAPTLPRLLGQAGYATVLVGRYMHQVPEDEPYGYQQEVRGSTYVSGDDYDRFLKGAAPESGGIVRLVETLGLTPNGWQAKAWPLPEELHPTAWAIREGQAVLQRVPAEKPLFLTASFFSPHPPLFPPKAYFEAFSTAQLPAPAHGDWVDWPALSPTGDRPGHRVRLEGQTLRAAQAGYFGLIEHLDAQVLALVDAFKERSQKAKRPWIIVFTSDHGEMLGDHGFFRKCEPYEGAANIPFVITASGELGFKAGVRCQAPVCLEDLLPTLLELAGAQCPQPMDGISLVPVLRGQTQVVRPWLHLEHAPCYGKEQAFHALTDGHMKYVWRPGSGAEQFFDLDQDSREEHDLCNETSRRGLLEQCRSHLIQLLANRPEG